MAPHYEALEHSPGARVSLSLWERGRHSLARMMGIDLTHTQAHYARVLEGYVHLVADGWSSAVAGRFYLNGQCP